MTAPARARRVFLQGHGLPQRWAGRPHFVVLVAGFGAGEWFLALWDTWRQDPARCAHLHVVAIEPQPLAAADLAGAQADSPVADLAVQLHQAWPPATRNLHLLDFEQGQVQLTLAFGDLHGTLRALRLSADSIGLGPWSGPSDATGADALSRTVKALARLAAPGATLVADDTSPPLHASLRAAGFQLHVGDVPTTVHVVTPIISCDGPGAQWSHDKTRPRRFSINSAVYLHVF